MRMHPVVAAGLGLLAALFAGSLVWDYFVTTAHVDPITIVDKRQKAGYYKNDCPSNEEDRRRRCPQVWVPPEWLLIYSDGGVRHDISVTSEGYDRFKVGDREWISYRRGGVWGTRYDETITSRPPDADGGR